MTARPAGFGWGDVTGAVADLGIFIPLTAALVLVNGLSAGMVLVAAGALLIFAGARFGIPFPVQPLKALTAVAVARQITPDVIAAAGLIIGLVLLVFSAAGLADRVARWFSVTIVRSLQCGVGLLLLVTALRLAVDPPAVFGATFPSAPSVMSLQIPSLPAPAAFWTALFLLVLPQLPLTFGNAVVAVSDVAHRSFGERGSSVTPARVCRTAGLGNVVSALVGGMPMCHGSSGLTAHYRLGARTAAMNYLLGGTFIAIGVAFGDRAPAVLGQIPPLLLAALLAYAGARHALLVNDLRGRRLIIAIGAGLLGAILGNLLITMLVALVFERMIVRRHHRSVPTPLPTPSQSPSR
jgi:SulP family sulfate permease